ncbi:MAG: hypothetical protein HN356_09255 [Calditrichaeota bacterium]|nr:hypothetical protein [Calditrichota bacterium]
MRLTISTFAVVLLVVLPVMGLNLERFGYHMPDFFVHSLDVEIYEDLALLTGYGGFMIYDISDGGLQYLNRYNPGGGRGTPVYDCTAHDGIGYVFGRAAGMWVVDISDPRNPSALSSWRPNGQSLEDGVYCGDKLTVSAHDDGLIFLDVSNPRQPAVIGTFGDMSNCWAVRYERNGYLFVADGPGGLAILNLAGDEPELVSRIETTGQAIDLRIDNDICAVATGATGVDLFDISDPENPVFISNFVTPNYAGKVGLDENLVAVADWNEVLVYDISDPENAVLNGRKHTEKRAMGVALRGTSVYLADWGPFRGFNYGEIEGPDIEFSTRRINPPGDDLVDTTITVYNLGSEVLQVNRISCNAPEFGVDPGQFSINPEDSVEISLTYQPTDQVATSNMQVQSNDTDENRANVALEGIGGLAEGDRAPDFTAPILSGGEYTLSDQRGRVQLLIFWASW